MSHMLHLHVYALILNESYKCSIYILKLVKNINVNNDKQTFCPHITSYSKSQFQNKADKLALRCLSKNSTVSKCLTIYQKIKYSEAALQGLTKTPSPLHSGMKLSGTASGSLNCKVNCK